MMGDPGHKPTPSQIDEEVDRMVEHIRRDERQGLISSRYFNGGPIKEAKTAYTCSFCGREVVDHWELDPCDNCGGRTPIDEATKGNRT